VYLKKEHQKLHEGIQEMRSSQDVRKIEVAEAQENLNCALVTKKNRYDQWDKFCDSVLQRSFKKIEQLEREAAQSAKQIEQCVYRKNMKMLFKLQANRTEVANS